MVDVLGNHCNEDNVCSLLAVINAVTGGDQQIRDCSVALGLDEISLSLEFYKIVFQFSWIGSIIWPLINRP